MSGTLEASRSVKQLVLLAALAVVAIEVALFVVLWRIGSLVDPGADRRAAFAFIALGSVMTLQAMGVVGLVWMLVAMTRTTLRYDAMGLALEHPWRAWHGDWSAVRHAWHQRGWLVLELAGQWRRWYVWAGRDAGAVLAPVRSHMPGGTWLEGAARRQHLMRTVLPILLGATGVAGLALLFALRLLDRLR
jgi:hypothetical protein